MHYFAVTAADIGYWGDKLLYAVLVGGCLLACFCTSGRKRRKYTRLMEDRDVDNTADIQRSGPPRFNG